MRQPPPSRRVVPSTRLRDTLIAVGVGAAVLGGIIYAVVNFSQQAAATGWIEGVIVSKHFAPQPETQITFGKDGLSTRRIDGEYSFEVRVPQENNREYRVPVDQSVYAARNVGDHFLFRETAPGTP